MSLSNDELLSNIKRQAKRLSKNTNVPLRQAQSHLAMCVYQCDDWVHLRDSLNSDLFDNQLLLLASLQPNSDVFFYKLLYAHMNNIVRNFNNTLNTNYVDGKIEDIIIKAFGIEPSDFMRKIK